MYAPQTQAGRWVWLGTENQTVSVPPNTHVRYGKDGRWVELVLSGTFVVENSLFGDPAPGVPKDLERFEMANWHAGGGVAYPQPPHAHHAPSSHFGRPPPGTGRWLRLGFENDTVTVGPNTLVRYGHGNRWTERVLTGTFRADNNLFGDPAPGVRKEIERFAA